MEKVADVRDVYGNQMEMTDELGNPVHLTDEHGHPMHLTGVATAEEPGVVTEITVGTIMVDAAVPVPDAGLTDPHIATGLSTGDGGGVGGVQHQQEPLRGSSSSGSSSSEDDGHGGRRKKKKGLKEKIKEKLTGRKHKPEHPHPTATAYPTTISSTTPPGQLHLKDEQPHTAAAYPTTISSATPPGQHPHEPEKKSVLEKIKEKLPGHHHP
ncbi:Late embryogenesis abundant protein [Actinidia chinensis var. chinensis]|uniref:Late embryogenesis abundant protein n=1 Tax=Actinidia chinensis var. chinensis TaxID=1590841 RepID=A0A2R6RHF5_ACTCC|nr:Late embryogenesis abundant protein [Actinidia chinensis var. chinensis]